MADRIDIERALDDLISNEEGMRFQGLAVVLAKLRWPELIACERHKDLGLDAYASPVLSPDRIGKGLACSITPTFTKLNGDAKATKEHYNSVSLLVFATPHKVSKTTEKQWADIIRTEYGYELVVISREEIIASLQFPNNAWICRTLLKIPIPYQPSIIDLLQQTREAAAAVAAAWAAHPRLAGKPQIALNAVALDESGNETREVFATLRLRTSLLSGRRIVLEGPAGRGKTTTLIQLAQANGDSQGIPMLVDLPGWIKSGIDILEYIARNPAFRARDIDAAALAQVSQAEPCLFLLNGWNEISELHSQDAVTALHTLERAFPAAGIIVATRTHHIVPPLPGSERIRLLPLTPTQRSRYLEQALGTSQAHELNSKLSVDRLLDDLTRTPFILSEVTTIFRSGREIPRTKLGLLGAVVDLMEQAEEHRSHLHAQPLRGRAEDYLRSLAIELTARGNVMLGEAEARTVCHSVSEDLRDTGQIANTPEPAEILSSLSSHHILERLDYPSISFRFEHQQFQEYYSAMMLRGTLATVTATGDSSQREAFAQKYINEPAWEEPLRMITEEEGVADGSSAVGKFLVQTALRVDPIFAAKLARLCGASVWSEVRSDLSERLRSWYAVPNQHHQRCALAAMMATGFDEFADILIPLLTSPDQQVRLATYHAAVDFHPSSLGSQWQQIVAGWQEQARIEFISELTMHQGRIEVALAFARSDPSPIVRVEAIRALAWAGQHYEVAKLLQALPDTEFGQALQKLDVDDIPLPLRSRAISSYKAHLTGTTDPKARLQIVLTLAELGDADVPMQLKDELTNLSSAILKEVSDYSLRPAVDVVRRIDPQWVSRWVADRIIEGVLWGDSWLSLVSGVAASLKEQLLQRVCTENLQPGGSRRIISLLAATADAGLGKAVFSGLCNHRRQLSVNDWNEENKAIDRQLRDLFQALPTSVVVEGLSDVLAKAPDGLELSIVTEMFGRMGSQRDDLRSILPDTLRQHLRRYLKAAVSEVLTQDDFHGEAKGRLASALAAVGDPDDMADLFALIRADIERVRQGRLEFAQDSRTAKAQGSRMSYAYWHVQALVRLDHTLAESVLVDLLQEPEYELDAALALRAIAKKQLSSSPIVEGRFGWHTRDYRKVRNGPPEWSTTFDEDRRIKYAAAVSGHILHLLEESMSGDHKAVPYHYRLKELAKVLAALDPEHSVDLILKIARLPASFDGWSRVALLEALVFGGVTLQADQVMSILDPVIEQLRTHGIYNDNANLLRHLLCILPFVDPPARGIACIRDLFSEFRLPLHDQRDLLIALGQCACDEGLSFLRDLAQQNDDAFQHIAKEWIEAVAASPLPGGRAMLLSFIDSEVTEEIGELNLPDYATDLLASRLSDLAEADPALAGRILQLSNQPLSPQRRQILAKVIARLDAPQSLLAGLNLIDDGSPQPIPYDLWKAIEDVFLEKRPYKGNPQSHTLVPRAASDIKKRLFEMTEHDSRRARSAYTLLGQIEEWRLEYGRPSSEPRHPAYESGKPWPPLPPDSEEAARHQQQ